MKNVYLLTFLLITIFSRYVSAQKLSAGSLVKAWRADDTSQTSSAEYTYADLKKNINPHTFAQRIKALDNYLRKHPDKRLEARMIMYDILGKEELGIPLDTTDINRVKHAIILAGLLEDDQLSSELYSLYAEHNLYGSENKLFYALKAVEMQQKTGIQHFPLIYLRFLTVSKSLYSTMDYKQSILYGLKCLQLMPSPQVNLPNYILQLDNLGAAYKELGMADSTIYYYSRIRQVLDSFASNYRIHYNDSAFINIWRGIAGGGIGQALFLQQKYAEAYPLLSQNVRSSIRYGQTDDAAMAQNTLAAINFIRKDYNQALNQWKEAYQWALQAGGFRNAIYAANGIVRTYQVLNRYDSAFLYNNISHSLNNTLQERLNQSRLASVQSRIEYDDLHLSLANAQTAISRQIHLRNSILAAIALLAIIILMLYRHARLQQKLRGERLERERNDAATEAASARQQIADAQQQLEVFTRNISEKNKLIERLQTEFGHEMKDDANAALRHFTILTENDWQLFKESFAKVHPGFWQRLHDKMPGLTVSEQRFMALSRLGLNNKEMAAITGVSPQSMRVTICRLRKKFTLPDTAHIQEMARRI